MIVVTEFHNTRNDFIQYFRSRASSAEICLIIPAWLAERVRNKHNPLVEIHPRSALIHKVVHYHTHQNHV